MENELVKMATTTGLLNKMSQQEKRIEALEQALQKILHEARTNPNGSIRAVTATYCEEILYNKENQ